jgi:hypothetical protein
LASKHENIKYHRSQRKFPLRTQCTATPNAVKEEYNKLKCCIEIQAPEIERQAPWDISQNLEAH